VADVVIPVARLVRHGAAPGIADARAQGRTARPARTDRSLTSSTIRQQSPEIITDTDPLIGFRDLRTRSGMNGRDFATALGTGQPKISKIETGRQMLSDEDVPAWCDALEVAEADTRALLAELADLRVEQATWQRQLRSGHRARQDEIQTLEQSVTRIRAVDVMAVPGIVQTPAGRTPRR
jgi:transcriptional regulator with XRE-family HTH domain